MPDTAHPLLIPTAQPPNMIGTPKLSMDALAAVHPLTGRTTIYGRPSEQPAVGFVRAPIERGIFFHTQAPDRAEYDRVVVWLGATNVKFRAPLGSSVSAQRNRTFGGYGPPYYQARRAPNQNDIARAVGGLING